MLELSLPLCSLTVAFRLWTKKTGSPDSEESYKMCLFAVWKNQWRSFFGRVSSVQFSSVTQLCPTLCDPWTTPGQASLSITNSQSLLKLMSIESVMPPNHQSFPASGSFQMSQFFASGGQSIGVSASTSVLPMNIQDWFLLGWTGWIFLQSKGLSRVFSNTTVQKHQLFSA